MTTRALSGLYKQYDALSMGELKQQFDRKIFAVPNLQRQFVWNANKATELANSIYKGYPIGMILIWKTKPDKQMRRLHKILPAFDETNNYCWNLLDGQQRISVIYKFYNPSIVQNERKQEIDFTKICFSLKEDKFTYLKADPDEKSHFSLCEILSGKYSKVKISLDKKRKLKRVKQSFESLKVPFYFLHENNLEYVIEAFVRLNTKGTALPSADKVLTIACNVKLRDRLENFKEGLPYGFDAVDNSTLIDAIAYCLGTKDISELAKNNLIKKVNSEEKLFDQRWKDTSNAFGKSINFLKNLGAIHYAILPSKTMVPVLSVFFYQNNNQAPTDFQSTELKKWFWKTALGSRYSGRHYREHILKDITEMKDLATKQSPIKVGYERIERTELKGSDYAKNSTVVKAYFCLLSLLQPLFLANGEKINLEDTGVLLDKKHKHHIFPKKQLMKLGIKAKKYNSIANICYLALQENCSINDELPFQYLARHRQLKHFKTTMKSHLIPCDNNNAVWMTNTEKAFNQFLEQRTELIACSMEKIADTKLFE